MNTPANTGQTSWAVRHLGFTLLEVMISLVILAIGVLGIVALQMSTYKSLQTSHNFANAAMLASDMADRILANPGQEDQYEHDDAPTDAPDCGDKDAVCNAEEMAEYDIDQWQTLLVGLLVGGTRELEPGSLPDGKGAVELLAGTTLELNIIVRWDDDLSGSTGTD
jgi:type IV pilus assembly protein PilV